MNPLHVVAVRACVHVDASNLAVMKRPVKGPGDAIEGVDESGVGHDHRSSSPSAEAASPWAPDNSRST